MEVFLTVLLCSVPVISEWKEEAGGGHPDLAARA